MKGRVWKFGDNIDTDAITPGKYMSAPEPELRRHVLEVINPKFPREVKPGDFIIAGNNFGCGSSRESAPAALKTLGVAAIVAESFARIFFRNAIAIGLPALTCAGVSSLFADGDELVLEMAAAKITNVTRRETVYAQPLPEQMIEVLSKGGIAAVLKEIATTLK